MQIEVPVTIDDKKLALAVTNAVADRITATVESQIADDVQAQVQAAINSKVDEFVEAELAKPFQAYSKWGDKQGESMTVREMIAGRVEATLKGPGQYSSRDDSVVGRIAKAIADEVERKMFAEVTVRLSRHLTIDLEQATVQKVLKEALKQIG